MGRGSFRFAVLSLCFISILSHSPGPISGDAPSLLNRHSRQKPIMVLPLVFSPLNSSRIPSRKFPQRQLHGSEPPVSNAHMRLYDDLLSNGYYTTRIWIGTPPQEFALIVDSGSTVTYVPCSTCEQCGNHQDPKFQPELSSTYEPEKCHPDCTCDNDHKLCIYERQYAEMSSSSGVLGRDVISFGNESALGPQRALFGCENAETGDLYSQHADGIMGLGRGDLSIVDQLVDDHVISDSFSMCYGGMDVGGGAMVLGEVSAPSDMVFSKSDPDRSPYYNIELKEINVAGKPLHVDPKVFDGKHGTVLDSGTTYAYLPEPAFLAFKRAIFNEVLHLRRIHGPDPNYNDICFSGAGSDVSELSKSFPSVAMVFSNGQNISLTPENYLFRHSKVRGAYCLGIFQNGKDPTTLLGGIVVRNTLVTYDREHKQIGFWKTNCSELWKRLNISNTPLPSPPADEVPTSGKAPAAAPNGSPESFVPGERIGVITFSMKVNMKYSDLKPLVPELSGSFAHELGVRTSQVRLLNLTSEGNSTLIKWAVYPEGASTYFSNETVANIVAHLENHDIQLPKDFGSYELGEWSTESAADRTWWHQHYLLVVMACIFIMILGLSAYGVWFVWKWRQQANIPYKPVDNAVPEQELQPLN